MAEASKTEFAFCSRPSPPFAPCGLVSCLYSCASPRPIGSRAAGRLLIGPGLEFAPQQRRLATAAQDSILPHFYAKFALGYAVLRKYLTVRIERATSPWQPSGCWAVIGRSLTSCPTERLAVCVLHHGWEGRYMLMLLIIFILLVAVLPTWPYSRGWGYYPTGGLGTVLLVLLILVLLGRV